MTVDIDALIELEEGIGGIAVAKPVEDGSDRTSPDEDDEE